MGLRDDVEATREMTTEEKVEYLLDGGVMTMVVVDDHDELDVLKSALADERYERPQFRWIEGDMTLQRGSRSATEEQQRIVRERLRNPQTDPTDTPDEWM